MSGLQERLAELSKKCSSADRRLSAICDERASHAVEAAMGSKSSLRRIAELDQEESELLRSRSVFVSAADQLDAQLKEQEAEAVKLSAAERDAKVRVIGAAVVAAQSEADLLMKELAECLARREARINELQRARGIDSRTAFRLASKVTISAAAVNAGLHRFMEISHVPPASVFPLNDSARIIPTPKDA